MPVTITLLEPLATQLRTQAAAHQLPLEEYALRLLDEAAGNPLDAEWKAVNERRVALIQKEFATGLSEQEAKELQQLQLRADQKLEALDNQRLRDVRRLWDLAQQVVSPSRT